MRMLAILSRRTQLGMQALDTSTALQHGTVTYRNGAFPHCRPRQGSRALTCERVHAELRLYVAWTHAQDGDARGCNLRPQRVGPPRQGVLAGAVAGPVAQAQLALHTVEATPSAAGKGYNSCFTVHPVEV